jgi:hypothetical protein
MPERTLAMRAFLRAELAGRAAFEKHLILSDFPS